MGSDSSFRKELSEVADPGLMISSMCHSIAGLLYHGTRQSPFAELHPCKEFRSPDGVVDSSND